MTLEEILQFDYSDKNICIIGHPASGKTFLSNKICPTHHKIHTDDYLEDGYFMQLHSVLNELSYHTDKPTLVEGVIGYRLLRKGVELASYYPDVVINIIISYQKQRSIYLQERDAKKLKILDTFNEVHNKIFEQYIKDCPKHKYPTILHFQNIYNEQPI